MTVPTRVIPVLLLRGTGLVKTLRYAEPKYLGDPRNAVRIFNEKEVDELVLLDIMATPDHRAPQFELVSEIVTEAFMPVAYGGGLKSIEDCGRILGLGAEKIVLNTTAVLDASFVQTAAKRFGSQSVVVSIDARMSAHGHYEVYSCGGRVASGLDPVKHAVRMEQHGAGEIIITSIDRDGTMTGYDLDLVRSVTEAVRIPVVANGGAGTVSDLAQAVRVGGASAVAAGSMFVFQGRHRAVLISFPSMEELAAVLGR